jgi:hypothetical protein
LQLSAEEGYVFEDEYVTQLVRQALGEHGQWPNRTAQVATPIHPQFIALCSYDSDKGSIATQNSPVRDR